MDVFSLLVALTISFGPSGATFERVDINATIGIPIPNYAKMTRRAAMATTIQPFIFYDPTYNRSSCGGCADPDPAARLEHIYRHELAHIDQQTALGPWFWPMYLIAQPLLEDYAGYPMWQPDPRWRTNCPLLRIENSAVRLMPCYTEAFP